jgi:hypothetical protein
MCSTVYVYIYIYKYAPLLKNQLQYQCITQGSPNGRTSNSFYAIGSRTKKLSLPMVDLFPTVQLKNGPIIHNLHLPHLWIVCAETTQLSEAQSLHARRTLSTAVVMTEAG